MQKKYGQFTNGVALSILFIGAAILLEFALEPVMGRNMLFILLAAVVLSALYSDLPVALCAAFVACMSHNYFFQLPRYSFMVTDLNDMLELLVFAGVAIIVSIFSWRLRVAMKAAEQATRAREEILAIVSHDLRNPLSVIEINSILLGRQKELQADGSVNSLRMIREASGRMNRLIQDLLDFEKIRNGPLGVRLRPCSAKKLLAEVTEAMTPLTRQKSIELQTALDGDDFEFPCDDQRLLQVFGNLIANAIKFSAPGTRISIRGHLEERRAYFSVKDQGPGISEEMLPHLFDRYWQARETAHLGTGLGLAISRGIIEAHDGRISVQSEMGAGTTFTIELPHASARAPTQDALSASA